MINDEENEDEFNVILRQQSAEDESTSKSSKQSNFLKDKTSKGLHNSNHNSNHNKHHHHSKHRTKSQNTKHQTIHPKQRNHLCRKLKCKYGANCLLDHTDANQTKATNFDSNQEKPINELNRISFEVTAYCDCSHINCDLLDRESDKGEELCGSDGKLYSTNCQMREKSCKLQQNITIKQRSFCESKIDVNDNLKEVIKATKNDQKSNAVSTKPNASNKRTGKLNIHLFLILLKSFR